MAKFMVLLYDKLTIVKGCHGDNIKWHSENNCGRQECQFWGVEGEDPRKIEVGPDCKGVSNYKYDTDGSFFSSISDHPADVKMKLDMSKDQVGHGPIKLFSCNSPQMAR